MAKEKSQSYFCSECSAAYAKWVGKCLSCGTLNSVIEGRAPSDAVGASSARLFRLQDLDFSAEDEKRFLRLDYLNRLVGGGLPPGTVVLLAGEPGIGKSTPLFQWLANETGTCLYVSAEESVSQIGRRFRTLGKDLSEKLYILSEHRLSEIVAQMKTLRPALMVIDSIQMISGDEERSKGGSALIRDVTDFLVNQAKELGIILFIVGHVNKDGEVAGPKTMEHLVDTVLLFSMAEDSRIRILQVQKNRFGPTGEVVLLEMTDRGLHESKDFDSYWTQKHQKQVFGCALSAVMMGSRLALVEIQALVVNSFFPSPRRSTSGYDLNRLLLLLAVLEKRLKVPFSRFDVYLNIVGGIKVSDPGADLAVAAALLSAHSEKALPVDAVFVGEVGLTGELRAPKLYPDRLQNLKNRKISLVVGPSPAKRSCEAVDDAFANFLS